MRLWPLEVPEEAGQLLSLSTGVVIAKASGAALGLVFSVALARILGPDLAGVYFLGLLVASVAAVVGRGGMDNVVLRFSAVAESREAPETLLGVHQKARAVALGLSGVAAILVIVGAEPISRYIFDEPRLTHVLRIIGVAVPFSALAALDLEVLKGIGRPRLAATLETVLGTLIGLLLLVALGIPYGLAGAATAHTLTAAVLGFLIGWRLRRQKPVLRSGAGHFDTALLIRTAVPLFWVTVIGLAMGIVDTAMLGILAESRDVGIYGVAARVAALASFVLHAINTVVAPRFAALHEAGRMPELQRLARLAAGGATTFGLPVVAACVIFPAWILSVFGPGFVPGATALTVLALGHLLNAVTGPVGYLLMMTGHERAMRNNMIASGLLNVGLNAWLIPQLGLLGAAVGTAASLGVLNLVSAWLVYRKLGVSIIPLRRAQ